MIEGIHTCDTIHESKKVPVSIEKVDGKWYWVFWGKKKNKAHGIRFCPYCGEELK